MILSRLRVRNFRCFQDEVCIDFEDMTALIGKNDAGKSTLMDALELFLNDSTPDKDDATKGGDGQELTIICEFTDLPEEVVLDDNYPTKLSTEFLQNEEGRLEIHKSYSGHLQTPKCTSIEAFAVHPTVDGAIDLLQLKNAELKRRAEQLNINLEGVDLRVNAQIRAKIRNHLGDLQLKPTKISLNEDNAKKIWTELRKYIPVCALFRVDRVSKDSDSEVQDPLKIAIKEAIKAKEAELTKITEYVMKEVQEIADLTLAKLREMDANLATQLRPIFGPPKWDGLFKASIMSDDDIPINKHGSGVRRLILLNFFRAKAEQLLSESEHSAVIYAFEEPETSQHPNSQRMLLRALSHLSTQAQVIISTHTPMLARTLSDSCLRYIHVNPDKSREILTGGPETNQIFAKSLGVLPDNTVKLLIGVEGHTDVTFLQTISSVLRRDGVDVLDLERLELDGEVILFLLGGSTLVHWISRTEPLNRPEFYLYDRDTTPPDPPKYQAVADEVNANENRKACITKKKEIENYLHKDAIVAAYKDLNMDIQIDSNFESTDDVPQGVARLVHDASQSPKEWDELSDDKKKEKESHAKRILCSRATKYMTKTLLDEIDPDGDLLGWFEDMKNLMLEPENSA